MERVGRVGGSEGVTGVGGVDRGEEVKKWNGGKGEGVLIHSFGCMIAVYPKPNTTHNKGLSSQGSH